LEKKKYTDPTEEEKINSEMKTRMQGELKHGEKKAYVRYRNAQTLLLVRKKPESKKKGSPNQRYEPSLGELTVGEK